MIRRFLFPVAFAAVCALCLGFVQGCGDDDDDNGTEPDLITLEDLAGSWTAATFVVKSQANPEIQFDLIADAGGSVTMDTQADGTFTGEAQVPDPNNPGQLVTLPLAGTFSLPDQEHIETVFTPEYPPMFTSGTMDFTLSGDTMVLKDPNTTFDFDMDGTEDPATFEGTMVRS
jgi:hypothetical protein